MKIKRLVIISLLALMILGCVSTVSAGWFDFGSKEETYMLFDHESATQNKEGSVSVILDVNHTNGSSEVLLNKKIQVNVTDQKGNTTSYEVNSIDGYVDICNLTKGNYTVSAAFDGDDDFNSCNLTKDIEISEISENAGSDSNVVAELSSKDYSSDNYVRGAGSKVRIK